MEISGIGRILYREERHIKPPVIILYVKPLVNVSLENVKFKLDLILIARSAPRTSVKKKSGGDKKKKKYSLHMTEKKENKDKDDKTVSDTNQQTNLTAGLT
ncbi:hypothetical protein T310_9503 [Rasamsonia emersonii CBS 393.64]|uniref:Uncharacterized protein n=1 Tax=Rasamsonia emersonii (strain ATCC 16479 / CBS 393.64 / IMI 116815) TaxID=1408163 RepID=A0A0F4YFF7_RASE3|nr:hypothetical protein T310_9503 [Rasamsonia emersonii CBS 393.64]KKA16889.1 hypothetical protein T310_9503 [Rasamsonia emersonii CBS 393.64]